LGALNRDAFSAARKHVDGRFWRRSGLLLWTQRQSDRGEPIGRTVNPDQCLVGTATQTIDAFSSISGGGGLHLLSVKTDPATAAPTGSSQPNTSSGTAVHALPENATPAILEIPHTLVPSHRPELRGDAEPSTVRDHVITPHFGFDRTTRDWWNSSVTATAADAIAAVTSLATRRTIEPVVRTPIASSVPRGYVDPINVAWLTLHGTLDRIAEVGSRRGIDHGARHGQFGSTTRRCAREPHSARGHRSGSAHPPRASAGALVVLLAHMQIGAGK